MNDSSNFLKNNSGSKHPAFKFDQVGDTLAGVIVEEPREVETENMNTKKMEAKLVVAVCTDEGVTFALWVKAGFMAGAIWEACQAAGSDGLAEGGRLAVQFSGTKDTGKPQPAKLFTAEYQPPAAKPVGGSLLGASASQGPAV